MIDATKAAEAASRMYERLTGMRAKDMPGYSSAMWFDDARLAMEFCRQVERERAAMPEKMKHLRDKLAGQALQGLLAKDSWLAESGVLEALSRRAYQIADAMLVEREKKK